MKKILVPCDFSNPSFEAFKTALDIAHKTNGEIILMYSIYIPAVYDPAMSDPMVAFNPNFTTEIEEDARKRFNEWVKPNRHQVKIRLEIIWGKVLTAVTKAIDDMNVDLVIMGTNGTSGLREFFIGSNTEKVVRYSNVPVLAIHKRVDPSTIKNILLPTTLTLHQTDFVKKLVELQKLFHAHLHLLHVNTPDHFKTDSEVTEMMEEFVKNYKLTNYTFHLKNNGTEENGIAAFMKQENIDLIAMATHARKGIAHLFNTSITEDVVNHLDAPVWTYSLKQ